MKKDTADIMAEEKRTKRLLDANKEQIDKYDGLARKALAAGNEDDARVLLEKKQEYVNNEAQLQKAYSIAYDNAVKMREMHDKLTKDVQILEQRRKNVKANVAVAKTQERINKVSDSMSSASKSIKAFERMEEKAEHMLDEANAAAELEQNTDPAIDLEEKYSSSSVTVDEELKRLKDEMGIQ